MKLQPPCCLSICVLVIVLGLSAPVSAESPPGADYSLGKSIRAVVDLLRSSGSPFAYSSDILPDTLTISVLPKSSEPLAAVRDILLPYNLTVREFNGLWIIVNAAEVEPLVVLGTVILRVEDAQSGEGIGSVSISEKTAVAKLIRKTSKDYSLQAPAGEWELTFTKPGYVTTTQTVSIDSTGQKRRTIKLHREPQVLSEVVVFASHYELQREASVAVAILDQQKLNQSPDLGNDPMRAIQRLPGVTSDGASARSFVRGGTERESGIVLDGHRLLDPFHVRDYQSLFSAIDVRAVNSMEVFTGGFPVKYGNLNSSLILVDSIDPDEQRQSEFGLSVFNTSLLSAGKIGNDRAHWVFSGRRGNLDSVIDDEFGEPSYHDLYGKLSVDITPTATVSANALIVVDEVNIVAAADPEEREEAGNDTRNTQFWLNWDQIWSDRLNSKTIFSISEFRIDRQASINDIEKIVGTVSDVRDIQIRKVAQDWELRAGPSHIISVGGEFQSLKATYSYDTQIDYYGFFQNLPGLSDSISRQHLLDVEGDSFSFYASDRWQISDSLLADVGIRWDKETYTDLDTNGLFSPRVGLLYKVNPDTKLRFSWGRYYQAQQVQELQVEDGETDFFRAQRVDQWVVGIDHQLSKRYTLRAEIFSKAYTRNRPRFENRFDQLSIIPEIEAGRTRVAPDKATSEGIELSVAYASSDNFSWWANYVLSHAFDRIEGRSVDRSWDQRHALQLGLAWTGQRWSYSAAVNAHTGWPKTDAFLDLDSDPSNPTIVFGERNSERFSPYLVLDMRLEYEQPVKKGTLSWFLELSNTTNRKNPCCVDYDLDEDEFGNFTLDKEEDYWFPILPAIGFLWKF